MVPNNISQQRPSPSVIKNNGYVMNQAATTMFGFANNENEAMMMNLSRGYTQAYIFDVNKNVFYYKEIDSSGQASVFDTYEYVKVIPPEPEKPVSHEDLTNMENRILTQIAAMFKTKEEDTVG